MFQYDQRIGYLDGPYIQLTSPDQYVQDINTQALIDRGYIEIKKQLTYEKGVSSKALVVYAITDEAQSIDKKIFYASFKHFRYISYKLSDLV